ncbi:MAG: hypothetical protein NTY19_18370, partial [Planctomycetota bacterium]|nr:hypothetical protein [Planctomycetota bacterium]
MWCVGGAVFAAAPLPIYQPRVKMADIYFHHPGAKPALKYNHDETLFCAWCDYNARKTYIATSTDGVRWHNREVPTAPPSLAGQVVGFPTNHGLLTSQGVMMFPCSLAEIEEKFQPQG